MNNSHPPGIQEPEVLLPRQGIDLTKWAVVACDQFTSQPAYWDAVEEMVGKSPSTYHLILPETYLGTEKEKSHARNVFPMMEKYLSDDVFELRNGFLLIKRTFDDISRRGLLAALDLEQYDFSMNSRSLIRATEGTIIERLPPRIKIRELAALEIPHILVLIDDPGKTVIEPLFEGEIGSPVYDFDLMQNGGHICGYLLHNEGKKHDLYSALNRLRSPEIQHQKYNSSPETPPLLYAMGDGNHSLATAKAIWEQNKYQLPGNHPSRYALVEIVNLHDEGIEFEAIHRVIKGIKNDPANSLCNFFEGNISLQSADNFKSLCDAVDAHSNNELKFGIFTHEYYSLVKIKAPIHTLAVGNAQAWIDRMLEGDPGCEVDYIHGAETIHKLGTQPNCAGIYLPAMPKDALFKSVIRDGPLPRKTFSMGEAHQKRYYLECRKIK